MPIRLLFRLVLAVCCSIAIGIVPASPVWAQDKPEQEPGREAPQAAAPRSISDVLQILDQYKPDPGSIAKAQATLKLSPPETTDQNALFQFYFDRGLAAGRLSDNVETIASLRKARDSMTPGSPQALQMLISLASAEFLGGNILNAQQVLRERLKQIPINLSGIIISHEGFAAQINAILGDFDAARASLRNAEATFKRIALSPVGQISRHIWTASLERGRAEIFRAEGKLVEAEAAYRKALFELEADEPDRQVRASKGLLPPGEDGNSSLRSALLRRVSIIQRQMGRLGEAELNIRTSLKNTLERAGRYSVESVIDMQIFSFILLEQGRFAEATLMSRESLKSLDGSGAQPPIPGRDRCAQGIQLDPRGQWEMG